MRGSRGRRPLVGRIAGPRFCGGRSVPREKELPPVIAGHYDLVLWLRGRAAAFPVGIGLGEGRNPVGVVAHNGVVGSRPRGVPALGCRTQSRWD